MAWSRSCSPACRSVRTKASSENCANVTGPRLASGWSDATTTPSGSDLISRVDIPGMSAAFRYPTSSPSACSRSMMPELEWEAVIRSSIPGYRPHRSRQACHGRRGQGSGKSDPHHATVRASCVDGRTDCVIGHFQCL